jgi:hypothetical protein
MENLLPACKNLGTTRITSGAARVHPVEWSIGEASGALAAFSMARGVPPRAVRARPDLMEEFQAVLAGLGAPVAWPTYGADAALADGIPATIVAKLRGWREARKIRCALRDWRQAV